MSYAGRSNQTLKKVKLCWTNTSLFSKKTPNFAKIPNFSPKNKLQRCQTTALYASIPNIIVAPSTTQTSIVLTCMTALVVAFFYICHL